MTSHTVSAQRMRELQRRLELLEQQQVGREVFNVTLSKVADSVDNLHGLVKSMKTDFTDDLSDFKKAVEKEIEDLRAQNSLITKVLVGIALANMTIGGVAGVLIATGKL